MSIKPILFNTDMVRAILDGRKTVTRRILAEKDMLDKKWGLDREPYLHKGKWYYDEQTAVDDSRTNELTPKYHPGDILYVRETWNYNPLNEYGNETERYIYKATYDGHAGEVGWRPSIHMPKEAARIWLKVTNVRVERLRDITTDQAEAEGVEIENDYRPLNGEEKLYAFSQLWAGTVKEADIERYGWESNPWVWVIEFERRVKPQEVKLNTSQQIRFIANHYGLESQSRQLMEECGELAQATNKVWRLTKELSTDPGKAKEYVTSENNLVEEMADVSIMIAQIQEILGISNEKVTEQVDVKLNREIERIQKGGMTYQ